MDEFTLIRNIAIVLGGAVAGGLVARLLRQSAIVGYLLAGIAIGPYALNLIGESAEIRVLATLGVILLLFTLGVEFSLRELMRLRKVAIGGGILQLLVTTGLGTAVGTLLGWSLPEALIFGFLIAISSTMVVIGMLYRRGELESIHGRVMIAILLMQDIAAAFMMFIFPALGSSGADLPAVLGWAVLKATAFLFMVLLLGAWIVPRFIRRIANPGSRELFVISSALLCFGGGFAAHYFGLSAAIGAFAIGLIISESDFAHQVLGDMMPLRDIFAALFFVSIGMLIDLPFIAQNIGLITLVVLTIVLGKSVICAGTARLLGYRGKTVPLVGAGMMQIGEFSFVLAELGLTAGIVTGSTYSLILACAMISIVLTPFGYDATARLATRLIRAGRMVAASSTITPQGAVPLSNSGSRAVLCGHGRVGGQVARMLGELGIPYVVIDLDPTVITRLRNQGIPCIYGDVGNRQVMRRADLEHAAILLLATPDPLSARLAIDHARSINPQLDIVARVHSDAEFEFLRGRGDARLVRPELEASIELVRHTMCKLGMGEDRVQEVIGVLRATCPV